MVEANKLNGVEVAEEGSKLIVPSGSEDDPFHKLAFYNPKMSFNRSVSSLALAALHETDSKFNKIVLLDGLCATGARGIRYALENSFVKKVFFVDANEHSLELLEKNLALNGLANKSVWVHSELNEFLENSGEQFDFVEIDPFGTPAPFLEKAVEKICFGGKADEGRGYGVLSVTATDLAALCGKEEKVCVKNYGSKPLKCSFSHEIALRILVKKVVEAAEKLGRLAEPLFCFYHGHSVKTICRISELKEKKLVSEKNVGFVCFCRNCLSRTWGKTKVEKCLSCGEKIDWAGPLWLGEASDKNLVEKMLELLKKRNYSEKKKIEKMLLSLKQEIGLPPFFYDLHEIAEKLSTFAPKTSEVIEKLKKAGFSASLTHCLPMGIRTDAPVKSVKEAFATKN